MALVDIRRSGGALISKGTFIESNMLAIHHNESRYTNPNEFDGFRIFNIQDETGEESAKNQFVAISVDSLPSGLGRHACQLVSILKVRRSIHLIDNKLQSPSILHCGRAEVHDDLHPSELRYKAGGRYREVQESFVRKKCVNMFRERQS